MHFGTCRASPASGYFLVGSALHVKTENVQTETPAFRHNLLENLEFITFRRSVHDGPLIEADR